jgi:ATP-dependent Clp protease protease subunit
LKKFWNWVKASETEPRTLYLNGAIAEESWFEDDVTPAAFKAELMSGKGDIVVWINSPAATALLRHRYTIC